MHVLSDLPVGAAVKGLSRSHFGEKFCAELAVLGIELMLSGQVGREVSTAPGKAKSSSAEQPTNPPFPKWTSAQPREMDVASAQAPALPACLLHFVSHLFRSPSILFVAIFVAVQLSDHNGRCC